MQPSLLSPAPAVPGYPCAFSPDRRYRYVLWRHWGATEHPRYLMVIGLNPSTADERQDDPTVRRCIRFARDWGYDALAMTNLFAFRATDPAVMRAEPEPVGGENDAWLWDVADGADLVLAAWGAHGTHRGRDREVTAVLELVGRPVRALGFTKDGAPRHPLYIAAAARPVTYPGEVGHG